MKITLPIISFLVTIGLSLFSFASQAQTNVVPDDVEFQALKDLFDNLGGASWTNKTNWPVAGSWPATATSTQFKTWYGITVTNGDVTAIVFNVSNNIQGIIPSSIGNLAALQYITISNNILLTSPIPASIGSLTKLITLSFPSNKLSGSLPPSIASLTNLTTLNVASNALTGDIPDLSALTKLTSLDLSGNSYTTGPIPSWIPTITTLTNLNLSGTLRTGSLPDGIGNLVNLTSFNLTANQLSGPIPSWIGNLTKLTNLQLRNNQLTGPIPDAIGNLTNLITLWLQNNQLTSIPSTIGNLTNVTTLYIFNNKLASPIPPEMGNMTKLYDLEIHANLLTGPIPSTFGNLSNLITLNLSTNQLTGSIPTNMGGLSKMVTLNLLSNKLTGSIPDELGNLTKLTTLSVQANQLTGNIPSSFGKLINLTALSVMGNQLSGSIPSSLGNLTQLTSLYLASNQLTGPIPDSFGNLTNLTILYLYSNQLSGSLPSSLGNLSKLVYLTVNNNQLTGPLPASLSGLSQLTYLYLYSNKFTGSFPAFNWPKINMIQIQYNYFTGVFPDVTNMPYLAYLSAANNLFTDIDPSILGKSQMTYIHFINNELTSIPDFFQHTNKGNLAVYVQSNRLNFFYLERLLNSGVKSVGTPLTQKSIHVNYVVPAIGSTLTIQAAAKGSQSSAFTWEKQVNGTWVNVNSNINTQNQDASQDASAYTRTSFALADEGTYRWKETSAAIAGVTLQSDPIQVKVPTRVAMDNWAFQYKYDARRRMMQKKVPGADWVYMVYDNRDRLVMTQDGNQRLLNQWTFTKYDALNRPVITGIYTHSSGVDQAGMQTVVNNYYSGLTASQAWYDSYIGGGTTNVHGYDNKSFPQLTDPNICTTVTYYDNYNFKSLFGAPTYKGYDYVKADLDSQIENGVTYSQPDSEFAYVTGQVTGTRVKTLPTGAWLNSVTYYDLKYRVVQTISNNLQGGMDRVSNLVDFPGKVLESKSTHNTNPLQWKTLSNANTTPSDLVSTYNGTAWGYSGAASVQTLPAGTDGWMEVTVSDINYSKVVGFSVSKTNWVYSSMNYGLYMNTNKLYVMENGINKTATTPVSIATGDILRIERIGTAIKYYKNGVSFYPSTAASSTSLLIDVDLVNNGSTAAGIRTSFAPPTPDVSVTRRFEYDHVGRLVNTWHKTGASTEVLLAKNNYNELGQLIDKQLYSTDNGANFKQSTDYRYNVRGWLSSINNSQLTADGVMNDDSNDLFGMELKYNDVVSGIDNTPQYNGNISAMKWSKDLALGTVKDQAYAYTYDTMNRIKSSAYLLNNGGWTSSDAFAENGFGYDLNGNIKKLTRTGTNGSVMDNLTYDYGSGNTKSNQLLSVADASDLANGFVDGNLASTDYTYDPTGSMTVDNNKGITAIVYNYLQLPQQVTKSSGDYIKYIYDATGRKLSQQVYNVSNVLKKKTDYAGEFYYENDTLKFINHEEGRIVMTGAAPEYQYHLKDHLGNVRTTFTTKVDIDSPTATFETANAPTEHNQFVNYTEAIIVNSRTFDHSHHVTPANTTFYATRLTGAGTNAVNGVARSLSVMPGDKIDAEVYAKYLDADATNWTSALADVMTTIATNAVTGTVVDGGASGSLGSGSFPFVGELIRNNDNGTGPKAYLNYLVFDRNYFPVGGGFKRLSTAAKEDGATMPEGVAHERLAFDGADEIIITQPGYVYIWVSNENDTPVEVYFDDFNVKLTKSPVIQTGDYYPFGLTFNEYQRENSLINKYKFNGASELQSDLGLNWYNTLFRTYDFATGRFLQVDPLTDFFSGISSYSFVFNNPISFSDPDGLAPDWWGYLRAGLNRLFGGKGVWVDNNGKEFNAGHGGVAKTSGYRPSPPSSSENNAWRNVEPLGHSGMPEPNASVSGGPSSSIDYRRPAVRRHLKGAMPTEHPPKTHRPPDRVPTFDGEEIPSAGKKFNAYNFKKRESNLYSTPENDHVINELVKTLTTFHNVHLLIMGNYSVDPNDTEDSEQFMRDTRFNRAAEIYKALLGAGVSANQLQKSIGTVAPDAEHMSATFKLTIIK